MLFQKNNFNLNPPLKRKKGGWNFDFEMNEADKTMDGGTDETDDATFACWGVSAISFDIRAI